MKVIERGLRGLTDYVNGLEVICSLTLWGVRVVYWGLCL